MKRSFTLLLLLGCCARGATQDMAGQRVLMTTASYAEFFSYTSPGGSNQVSSALNWSIVPSLLYGKVNSKGLLFAYGGGLGIAFSRNEIDGRRQSQGTSIIIKPAVILQKFFPIGQRLYYAPIGQLTGSWNPGKIQPGSIHYDNFNGTVSFTPFALAFRCRSRMNLLLTMGSFGVDYSHSHYSGVPNPIPDNEILTVGGLGKNYTVGLQWIL